MKKADFVTDDLIALHTFTLPQMKEEVDLLESAVLTALSLVYELSHLLREERSNDVNVWLYI